MNAADSILALHLSIAAFNVFGLVAVPLGGWLRWKFVYVYWWRALHLAALAVVALQKLLGRACFLTVWERNLTGAATASPTPHSWFLAVGDRALFWNLPLWFFSVLYTLVFAYALVLWWRVPPQARQ